MKILFNGRFLASHHPTGTHRSALSFLRALSRVGRNDLAIEVHGPATGRRFADLADCENIKTVAALPPDASTIKWHLWEQFKWPGISKNLLSIDPLNTGPFLGLFRSGIMFAHDINTLKIPFSFGWKFRLWHRFCSIKAMRKARHLVCFTNYVKNDLVKVLGIEEERITVIYQGPGLPVENVDEPDYDKEPFFLCVGSLQPHKNFRACIEAWERSGLATRGYRLIVAGKPQANFASLGFSSDKNLSGGIEFAGFLEDHELIRLYRKCTGFIYPSIEEGFGLPVVEAFFCGAPVITSNQSCLPEVAGGAALLVGVTDYDRLAKLMVSLAEDDGLRSDLITKGRARAKDFTWERAGQELWALVRALDAKRN